MYSLASTVSWIGFLLFHVSDSFVENQVAIAMAFFWIFFFAPLAYLSVFVLVSGCLCHNTSDKWLLRLDTVVAPAVFFSLGFRWLFMVFYASIWIFEGFFSSVKSNILALLAAALDL